MAATTNETSLNTDAFTGAAIDVLRRDVTAAETRVRGALAALAAELDAAVSGGSEKARLEVVVERLQARVLALEGAVAKRDDLVATAAARLDAVIEDLERWQQSAASPSS